jgi:hypothetical protein
MGRVGVTAIFTALLLALMQTLNRFRSKVQLWTYSGLGVETHDSAQHCYLDVRLQRSKKPQQVRGLNQNHNIRPSRVSEACPGREASLERLFPRPSYPRILLKSRNCVSARGQFMPGQSRVKFQQ